MKISYKYVPGSREYYIDSQEPLTIKTSYINPGDLLHCLQLYYANQLDDVDEFMSRLYLPESQLNPSNSLYGQLDSPTLTKALNRLPEHYRAAIKLYNVPNNEDSSTLQHYYINSNTCLKFTEWVSDLYIQSFISLSEEIRNLI
ncbi:MULTISPECIES: hypothetical protein [Calothrix]|uniref:Uncharacterized protein n=2 Tax=Calothrix TaxID=1186 RepID=A0ABR8A9P8_9CYAN|nr:MULTISPECIES: hypothetical protein [Calothrix]MBD2196603.1 hypothetical protein [Calothrix parietina FACHB-288]MBD2228032.1 hypothetical protein [Calothrix anomala FACHB-343]